MRRSGIIAIKLDKGDTLVSALITKKDTSHVGYLRWSIYSILKNLIFREMGRTAGGGEVLKLDKMIY